MASYSKVERRTWRDEKVRTWPRDTRELWHYLLTSPHMEGAGGKVGMYVLDPGYAAADLSTPDHRWSADTVEAELERLQDLGRILWDPAVNLVLLSNFLRQEQNHPDNPNVAKRAAVEMEDLPYSETLWKGLAERLRKYTKLTTSKGDGWCSHIVDAIENRIQSEKDTKGLREPFTPRNSNDLRGTGQPTNGKGYGNPSRARRTNPEPEPIPEPTTSTIDNPTGNLSTPAAAREGRPGRAPRRPQRSSDRASPERDGWAPDRICRKRAAELGKDLEFEVSEFRKANARHDTELRNPDAAFMRWLEKPRDTVWTPEPGSEAEAARAEEHQPKRQPPPPKAEDGRIQEVEQDDPERAARLRHDVDRQVDEDPSWSEMPEATRRRVADTIYRRRLLEEVAS